MDRRKAGDVLWYALQCAKSDRQGLVDAYGGDLSEPAVRDAKADIKAFERLQKKIFGTTKSQLEVMIDKMKPVPITELYELVKTNPELFDIAE